MRLLLKKSSAKRQGIIITGEFNNKIGDSFNPLTRLIQEFDLRDVHTFNHGYDYNIATYFCGSCRLDYFFVSCRIIDHVVRCGYEPLKLDSLPIIKHILLIFQLLDFLTAVFLFYLVPVSGTSVETTQKTYGNIFISSLIISGNIIC